MLNNAHVPTMGFAAFSGTGKTTLLLKLLPELKSRGLEVGVVKHAHHNFEIDYPGKDSYEIRKSGAAQTLITSRHRWALMVERELDGDPALDHVLLELEQSALDLILVEGFKHESFPKIELHRPCLRAPLLFPDDPSIVAVAVDAPLGQDIALPLLDLNRPDRIADFIVARMGDHATGGASRTHCG